MSRYFYFDNIKTFLILLVILTHSAIAYKAEVPAFHRVYLISASYIMGVFFYVSGYFLPPFYDRIEFSSYCKKKFYRLGIPFLLFVPILNFICNRGGAHLWFIGTLFIFCLIYGIVRVLCGDKHIIPVKSSFLPCVLIAIIAVSIFSWLIRHVCPLELWIVRLGGYIRFEPARYPQYIIMFVGGILSYKRNWQAHITYLFGNICLITGLILGIGLFYVPIIGDDIIYCCYESLFGVFMCIGIVALFRKRVNFSNKYLFWLSRNSFGAYIFHMIFLVFGYLIISNLYLPVFVKFLMLFSCTTISSFCFSWLLKFVPFLKNIL